MRWSEVRVTGNRDNYWVGAKVCRARLGACQGCWCQGEEQARGGGGMQCIATSGSWHVGGGGWEWVRVGLSVVVYVCIIYLFTYLFIMENDTFTHLPFESLLITYLPLWYIFIYIYISQIQHYH